MEKEEYEKVIDVRPEKEVGAVYETCRWKPIIEYNKVEMEKIRKKRPIKTILITCNLTPEYEFKEGWEIIVREREKITKELMEKYEEIEFIISTIEHHHTISEKMKKKVEGESSEEEGREETMLEVYKKRTIREFMEVTKRWIRKEKIIKDMTKKEKVVTWYNVLQMMHYLNAESGREEEFVEWIRENQEVMGEYMKREEYEVEWEEWHLGIISRHKEMGNSLIGYGHVHMAVVYAGNTNPERLRREMKEYLMEKRIFADPDVAETKSEKAEKEGKGITYILKNQGNGYVRRVLDKMGYGEEGIVKGYINKKNQKEYEEYMRGFVEKRGRRYFNPIGMEIYKRRSRKEEVSEVEIDPEKSRYNRTIAHIMEVMKENGLVINGEEIYKKVEGTKRTYRYNNTIEEFIKEATTIEPYNTIASKLRGEIEIIMKIKPTGLKMGKAEGNYRIEFPRIEMDYRMIEFKDFYFNTITAEIYKEQEKYYCHKNYGISIEDLEGKIRRFREKSEWLKILRNSNMERREVLGILFQLLRPKEFKSLVPILYGDSNAGKTTLISPFKRFYPESKVSTFVKTLSEYHIAELLNKRMMAIMEEGNPILNNMNTRSLLLTTLEGGDVVANKKHGAIKNMEQKANMVIMCNVKEDDIYQEDKAIMNRLFPIGNMKSLKEKMNMSERIKKEEPYIYLLTGLEYINMINEGEERFFEINERMSEEKYEELEEIKGYYEGREKEVEVEDIMSEEYIENERIERIKEKDNERRRRYEVMAEKEREMIKYHPILNGEVKGRMEIRY